MKWLALLACLSMATSAGARIDDVPLDESIPELVDSYIHLPCDAMFQSHTFQKIEIKHINDRYEKCQKWIGEHTLKYGNLMCAYVEMQRFYLHTHIMSLKKATGLMCNEDGSRKNPLYNIEF